METIMDFIEEHLLGLFIAFLCVGIVCVPLLFGNSGKVFIKNLESDYGNLARNVAVLNSFTGDTIFTYSGPCYYEISDGGVSLIYEVRGKAKKANFVGPHVVFTAQEK